MPVSAKTSGIYSSLSDDEVDVGGMAIRLIVRSPDGGREGIRQVKGASL